MAIAQSFIPEIDMEVATTRRVLERVPEDKLDWTPHDKSMAMGRLASHVAEVLGWAPAILGQDSLDINPPDGPAYTPPSNTTAAEMVGALETNAAAAKRALEGVTDDQMMEPWSLLNNGETLFTAPRAGIFRSMVMNHLVHHRAQLGVYLRLNDIAVPKTLGPTADETDF